MGFFKKKSQLNFQHLTLGFFFMVKKRWNVSHG